MNTAICFCGASKFYVELDNGPKYRVYIICTDCECRRRVKTPGVGCNYSIDPRFDGYEIDPNTGRMSVEEDLPKTEKMKRKLGLKDFEKRKFNLDNFTGDEFDKDVFLDKFDRDKT